MEETTYEAISAGILSLFAAALVIIKLSNNYKDFELIQILKDIVSFILRRK